MNRKILIMGLPGAGKTTLARELAPLLNAAIFNADEVRAQISPDLGFSLEDRIEHARRMGWMCDRVVEAGGAAIADFICPTPETRTAFGAEFTVWVDRITEGRFPDTNRMFVPPEEADVRVTISGSPRYWAEHILQKLLPTFDPQRPHRVAGRSLPALSRRASPPHRGGHASRWPSLCCRSEYAWRECK